MARKDDFEDMEDLDNALFGRSSAKPSKPSLGNLDSLFGDAPPAKPVAKRQNVSFLDSISTAPKSTATKSSLDDLFSDSSPEKSTPATSFAAPTTVRATRPQTANLDDLFGGGGGGSAGGPRRGVDRELTRTPPTAQSQSVQPAPISAPSQQVPMMAAQPVIYEDTARIKRLEEEIERLNRELDDNNRRRREDEEDLVKEWRERLKKKETDLLAELAEEKKTHQNQINKLTEDHQLELERLKAVYDRQFEVVQSVAGQTRETTDVVDRVDHISTTLRELASSISGSNERAIADREQAIRIKDQQLQDREDRLNHERLRLEEEKEKLYALNTQMRDLCKGQETGLEQEKWKVREEWNRLNAEKLVFKEDHKFILDNIEKQKDELEKARASFFREQHDLLVRVSNERQSLEYEKNEFFGKRSVDVRRLKEEATQLQNKIHTVLQAEEHAEDIKTHYETKLRQLQELEVSLMEECIEMESIRNRFSNTAFRDTSEQKRPTRGAPISGIDTASVDDVFNSPDPPKRSDSVRTVLRKHNEFLAKYTGQKVAAVAPNANV